MLDKPGLSPVTAYHGRARSRTTACLPRRLSSGIGGTESTAAKCWNTTDSAFRETNKVLFVRHINALNEAKETLKGGKRERRTRPRQLTHLLV
jgi:hypothetical protein